MALLYRPALRTPTLAIGRIRSGKLVLAVAVFVIIAVALLQVRQFSHVTSTGYELNQLNYIRAQKQAENHQLEAEVAAYSSLGGIDWTARVRLHMEPPKQVLYMDVHHPAPERESLPTRFRTGLPATNSVLPADGNQPFWKRLLKMLPFF